MNLLHKLKKKLKRRSGLSFTEMLAATIILLIAAEGMAHGITFASRQFRIQISESESHILFSSLEASINYELSHTDYISNAGGKLSFRSPTFSTRGVGYMYFANERGARDDKGYITVGYDDPRHGYRGNYLLTPGAYTKGMTAKIENLEFHPAAGGAPAYFSYTLTVFDESGNVKITNSVDVLSVVEKVET